MKYFLVFFLYLAVTLPAYAVPDISIIKKQLNERLSGNGDLVRRELKRVGNRTIEMRLWISAELTMSLAKKVLQDYPRYRQWALKNFNVSPTGGDDYRFHVNDLRPVPDHWNWIGLNYSLNIPLFTKKGEQVFELSSKEHEDYFELRAITTHDTDSLVEKASAYAYFFQQTPTRVWCYVDAGLTVRSWLLYQALPETLMERIIGDRVEKIAENLLEAQDGLSEKPTRQFTSKPLK